MALCFSVCVWKTQTPFLFSSKPQAPSSSSSSVTANANFKSVISRCSTSSEEHRWLREEQRWLREEHRWLREEQRWARERDSLLREIADLKLQIQVLERRFLTQDDAVLQVLKDKNLLPDTQRRMVLEEKAKAKAPEEGREKEVVVVEAASTVQHTATLRMGSEGEDVRQMQEALLKLGFYSGEEDMEYSSFSRGTDRAVKTWQASLGAPQDGIVTPHLLQTLYLEIQTKDPAHANDNLNSVSPKEAKNGAAVTSVTQISEVQKKVVEKGDTGIQASSHRGVFLLGENRWEEPSRLVASGGADRSKSKSKDAATTCLQCRGEGRLLCTECDGTGEPNIEPQFLEWVDEGTKCPYCEGLGYAVCDVCGGKTIL